MPNCGSFHFNSNSISARTKVNKQPATTSLESGNTKAPRFYIPSLDGIRAVSIAIVFLSHAGYSFIPGGFGVNVFFFLSGYLITTLLVREFKLKGTINLINFYWRRIWRIFPPMYAALALAVLVSLSGLNREHSIGPDHPRADMFSQIGNAPTFSTVAAQALHFSNYVNINEEMKIGMPLGSRVFWSLAVEEHFYLIFPVFVLFLLPRISPKAQGITMLCLCGALLVWRLILVLYFDVGGDRIFYATDTRFDAILFGCAMGLYLNPMDSESPHWSDRKALIWTGVGVALILASLVIRNEIFRNSFRYSLQSLALFPIFYAAIRRPDLAVFQPLNWSWVRFIGLLSYSLYLVHHTVILALVNMKPDISTPVVIVVAGIISLVIAYLFHVGLEKPAARMRKRYAST